MTHYILHTWVFHFWWMLIFSSMAWIMAMSDKHCSRTSLKHLAFAAGMMTYQTDSDSNSLPHGSGRSLHWNRGYTHSNWWGSHRFSLSSWNNTNENEWGEDDIGIWWRAVHVWGSQKPTGDFVHLHSLSTSGLLQPPQPKQFWKALTL